MYLKFWYMLLFICFTVFLFIIYKLNFLSSLLNGWFTVIQSCIFAGLFHSGDQISAPLVENTVRIMFVSLFSVISWTADHDFMDERLQNLLMLFQVKIKPKLVYTLTHSSFQSISHVRYIALLPTISLISATRLCVNCRYIEGEAIASSLL